MADPTTEKPGIVEQQRSAKPTEFQVDRIGYQAATSMIQAIIFSVGVLGGTSLVVGALIAVGVLVWARELDAAVRLISNGYYGLVGLMPVALWLAIYATHDNPDYEQAYASPLRALLTTLQGAVVGSILGAGPIFLAVVVILPVIVADFDIDDFGPAVRDAIVWSHLSIAVGAALLSALPLGLWAHYAGGGRKDD